MRFKFKFLPSTKLIALIISYLSLILKLPDVEGLKRGEGPRALAGNFSVYFWMLYIQLYIQVFAIM